MTFHKEMPTSQSSNSKKYLHDDNRRAFVIDGKISIIVPVFNVEVYLRECIESIMKQTYGNLEIILIDDGSTDQSAFICDEYANADDRIIVVHQENQGVSVARNKALEVATGNYIGFVDSDDVIHRDMYGILIRDIFENGADIAICLSTDNRSDWDGSAAMSQASIELFESVGAMKATLIGTPFAGHVWNKLFARDVIIGRTFNPGLKILEDQMLVIEILANSPDLVISFRDMGLYYYRRRNDSAYYSKGFTTKLSSMHAVDLIRQCVRIRYPDVIPYIDANSIINDLELLTRYDSRTDSKADFRSIAGDLRECLSWQSLMILPGIISRAKAVFAAVFPRGYSYLQSSILKFSVINSNKI